MNSARTVFSTLTIMGLVLSCSPGPTNPPDFLKPDPPWYKVAGLRKWYLTRTPVTTEWSDVSVEVTSSRTMGPVDMWVGDHHVGAFDWVRDTAKIHFSIADLPIEPGSHHIVLYESGDSICFFADSFFLSEPYCITVSNDWDIPSTGAEYDSGLVLADRLHEFHPHLVMTHFVGPYAFTDPDIPRERKQWLAEWVKGTKTRFGDEIGLHIHPYCNFVNLTGIECKNDSSYWTQFGPRMAGYSTFLDRYTEEETDLLLRCADSIFAAWDLGKPRTFRAGGWTAALHTLRSLHRAGHVVDASGCNYARGEEFRELPLYGWLEANWGHISDTSQPYYPSQTDIASSQPPRIGILEAPDNGNLVDYVDSLEMVEIFHKNWDGAPLTSPRHFSIGYHPDTFAKTFERLHGALKYMDGFLAADDRGPVVYVRMEDLVTVWR